MSEHAFTNRLIDETSPYLKQHAHNPVDWHPWDDKALRTAKVQDKPIFLSIGYSACHWCHVMERESFEDEETGRLLNKHFVSIKVDREERPDLDQIYMTAVQLLTRQGGWPMSVFLTPDLKPFFGGTYFPPTDQYQRPSFKRVLMSIVQWWSEKRDAVLEQSETLAENIRSIVDSRMEQKALSEEVLRHAVAQLRSVFDPIHGGFGSAPKFPHSMDLSLLLRAWNRFGDQSALEMVMKTLDMMSRGGMFDHLGGGFHRYSTDARWLAPHFEKMLYDNALLAQTYLEGYQATGDDHYRGVVDDILSYVRREMTSPDGAFYSTQDADSEGVEGKFFVWSRAEIVSILGEEEGGFFALIYDATDDGNWEETNILHRARGDEQEAKIHGTDVGALRKRLAESRTKLLAHRNNRIWPARDDKILTSWNGLMIAAFARAGQVLGNDEHVTAAVNAADYIWRTMRTDDGRLLHTVFPGSPPKLNGYLEDYAYLLDALVALYEVTFDIRWMQAAHELTAVMIDEFWDDDNGGFFDTGKRHEQLIARTKDPHDNATPSGNAMAVTALVRLVKLTGNDEWRTTVERLLNRFSGVMTDAPRAASQMLAALDFQLGPVQEFVVVGDSDDEAMNQAVRLIHASFRPNKVVAGLRTGGNADELAKWVPLLEGKTAMGSVTTYICENFACQEPIVGLDDLKKHEELLT